MEPKPYVCKDGSEIKDKPTDLTKARDLAEIGYFMGDDLQDRLPRVEGSGCIIMEGPREYDVSEFEGLGFLNIKHKLLKDLDIARRLEEEKARSGYEYGVYGVAPYLFQNGDDPKKFRLFIRIYAMRIGKPVTKE